MSPEPSFQVVPLGEVPLSDSTDQHDLAVVLVVDDERVIADTLSIILSKNGFAPMTAYDAETALELAAVVPPDLLLTDVAMPGMNGIDLAIAIAASIPDCKILLFSGQASTVDLLDRARHEGHHFNLLTKPVHPTDMLKRIAECLTTPPAISTPQPTLELISL
jgi:DNA-binding NtrC family response regulator